MSDRETLKRYCEVWDEKGWPSSANFGQSLVDNIRSLLERLEATEKEKCEHGWRGATPERGDRIRTPCPACGLRALFIGSGGHLTCSSVPSDGAPGCPSPSVQTTWDNQRARIEAAMALHTPLDPRDPVLARDKTCRTCRVLLPCPTVQALKGGESASPFIGLPVMFRREGEK